MNKLILNILIVMQIPFLSACADKSEQERLAELFEKQEHRLEIVDNRAIYNGHEIVFGQSFDPWRPLMGMDGIWNYKGISILPHGPWKHDPDAPLLGVEVVFAKACPKEYNKIDCYMDDDPEPVNMGFNMLNILATGKAYGGEKELEAAVRAEIATNGYAKRHYGLPPGNDIRIVPSYDPKIPDWYDKPDAAIMKFNGVYMRYDTSIGKLNRALKRKGQDRFKKYKPFMFYCSNYYRFYPRSHTDDVKINSKGKKILSIDSGVNYEVPLNRNSQTQTVDTLKQFSERHE